MSKPFIYLEKNWNYLGAFDATSGKLLFIASGTVNVLLPRDERLGANRSLANEAAETLFMPLSTLVFHLLGSCIRPNTHTQRMKTHRYFSKKKQMNFLITITITHTIERSQMIKQQCELSLITSPSPPFFLSVDEFLDTFRVTFGIVVMTIRTSCT